MASFKKLGSFFKKKGLSLLGDAVTGDVTGIVSTILESTVGNDKNEDEIIELLKNDKDAILKLKELENLHEEELLRLQKEAFASESSAQIENSKVIISDLSDARKMMTDTLTNINVPLFQKLMPSIVAFIILISTFGSFYLIFTKELPNENRDLIMMIVGVLLSKFSDLVGFYFGSSDYLNQSGKSYLGGVKK